MWAAWREDRPPPPTGRRTFDPVLIPDEAQAFVDQFSLGGLMHDWEVRTRRHLDRAGGDGRGTRRPRNTWDGGWYDVARTARPRH